MAKRSRQRSNFVSHYLNLTEVKANPFGSTLQTSGVEYVVDDLQEGGQAASVVETRNILPTNFGLASAFNPVRLTDALPIELVAHDVFSFDLRTGERATITLSHLRATVAIPNQETAEFNKPILTPDVLGGFITAAGDQLGITTTVTQELTSQAQIGDLVTELGEPITVDLGTNPPTVNDNANRIGYSASFDKSVRRSDDVVIGYGYSTTVVVGMPDSPVVGIGLKAPFDYTDFITAEQAALTMDLNSPVYIETATAGQAYYQPIRFANVHHFMDYIRTIREPAPYPASAVVEPDFLSAGDYVFGAGQPAPLLVTQAAIDNDFYLDRGKFCKLGIAVIKARSANATVWITQPEVINSVTLPLLRVGSASNVGIDIDGSALALHKFIATTNVAIKTMLYNGVVQTPVYTDFAGTGYAYYVAPRASDVITLLYYNNSSSADAATLVEFRGADTLEPCDIITRVETIDTSQWVCTKFLSATNLKLALLYKGVSDTEEQRTRSNIVSGVNQVLDLLNTAQVDLTEQVYRTVMSQTTGVASKARVTARQLVPLYLGALDLADYGINREYLDVVMLHLYPSAFTNFMTHYITVEGVTQTVPDLKITKTFGLQLTPRTRELYRTFERYTRWTKAIVDGDLYLYQQGLGYIVRVSAQDGTTSKGYPTFANMPFIQGIADASGVLIMWDSDGAIYRSSYLDPMDFTPAVKTQATVHKVEAMLGSIIGVVGLGDDYVLYSTGSVILCEFRKRDARFLYKTLTNIQGVFSLDSVTTLDNSTHIVHTNLGIQVVSSDGIRAISPEVSEFLASSPVPVRVEYLLGRYIALSAKASAPAAQAYTLIERGRRLFAPAPTIHEYRAGREAIIIPPYTIEIPGIDPTSITVTETEYIPPTFGTVLHDEIGNRPNHNGRWVYPIYSVIPEYRAGNFIGFSYKITSILIVPYLEIMDVFMRVQWEWISTIMIVLAKELATGKDSVVAKATAYVANIPADVLAADNWQTNINFGSSGDYYASNDLFLLISTLRDVYVPGIFGGPGTITKPAGYKLAYDGLATGAVLVNTLDGELAAIEYFSELTQSETPSNNPPATIGATKLEATINDITYVPSWEEVVQITEGEYRLTERTYTTEGIPATTILVDGVYIAGVPSSSKTVASGLQPIYTDGGEFIGSVGSKGNLPPVYDKTYLLDTQTGNWGSCDYPHRHLFTQSGINSRGATTNLVNNAVRVAYASFIKDLYAVDAYGNIIAFDMNNRDSFISVAKLGAFEGYASALHSLTWDTATAGDYVSSVVASLDGNQLDPRSHKQLAHKDGYVPLTSTGKWFAVKVFGKLLVKGLHYKISKGGYR